VPRFARIRSLFIVPLVCALAPMLVAAETALSTTAPQPPSSIVIGFVGGFVRHTNPHQQPVQLAQHIRRSMGQDTFVQVFENRRRKQAYNTILRLLDRDHDGQLSDQEKSQAHIVLFGHSWGAAAAVLLARDLDRVGVPVLLTVQVDSIRKLWQHDRIIPDNVAAAANFYQPHGLVHGRAQIVAADPSRTQILGNYRYDYHQQPVKCEALGLFDRITPSHAQSECDPHLWSRVEDMVRQHIEPDSNELAATPGTDFAPLTVGASYPAGDPHTKSPKDLH
jgi:pimeloyl-ACP methyl ester carboxylesterase